MTRLLSLLGLSIALLACASCGFSPVYGNMATTSGRLRIEQIDGRTGHFLRQELIATMPGGVPGYEGEASLEITLSESIARLAFSPDQVAARSDYIGIATFVLRGSDGKEIVKGETREAASFNFADSAYADISSQTAAQERVAQLLARSIRNRLLMGLKASNPTSTVTEK
jgi:LPS-assembly lipoprotein